MKKEQVELIIFRAVMNGGEALHMKIYKNGITCRNGAGGIPEVGIGVMSFVHDSRYFDPLLEQIPQDILDQPINYEEPKTPNGYMEYLIAFFGGSQNGDTGERADWALSTGVRVKLDLQSQFNHPIMGFLDGMMMEAAELTNELYFDAVMQAKWAVKSSQIPEESLINIPNTEEQVHEHYESYIRQMLQSARKWDMSPFVKDKTYEKDGVLHRAEMHSTDELFSIRFIPLDLEK